MRRNTLLSSSVAIALVASASACTYDTGDAEERAAATSEPLSAGWSSPDTVVDNAAVRVLGAPVCTGALVAQDIVLTARHCLTDRVSPWDLGADVGTSNWRATAGPIEVEVGGPSIGGAAFTAKAHFANEVGDEDAILLLLDHPVPSSIARPAPFMSAATHAATSGFESSLFKVEGYGGFTHGTRMAEYARITGDRPLGVNTITATLTAGVYELGDLGGPLFWYDAGEGHYYTVGTLSATTGGDSHGAYVATYRQGDASKPDVSAWLTSNAPAAGANHHHFAPFAAGDLWSTEACYRNERCATGDFDGDGRADTAAFAGGVYVGLSYGYRTAIGSAHAADGDGFEVSRWASSFDASTDAVGAADLDGDGADDAFAFGQTAVYVARGGRGARSFGPKTLVYSGAYCDPRYWTCITGDFDTVGPLRADDVLAIRKSDGYVRALRSTGTALSLHYAFATSTANGLCAPPAECHLADVDADFDDDLVVLKRDSYGTVLVLRATASGFSAPVTWTTGACSSWIASTCMVADVNGDRHADLVSVTHYSTGSYTAVLHDLGTPGPSWQYNWHRRLCQQGDFCMMADVTGDRSADLVVFPRTGMVGAGDVRIAASEEVR